VRTIALANQKGGSCKTTTAFNLSGALARAGQRVLLIDLDPQMSLSRDALGLEPSEGLSLSRTLMSGRGSIGRLIQPTAFATIDLIAGDEELQAIELQMGRTASRETLLRRAVTRHFGRPGTQTYDFVLIDVPPSLGFLYANAINCATEVILPVNLSLLSMSALERTLRSIALARSESNYELRVLGILIGNVKARTAYHREAEKSLREQFSTQVFRAVIPSSIVVEEAIHAKMPICNYAPSSALARAYRDLGREVLARGEE
jgi:chromosome partitioning protein